MGAFSQFGSKLPNLREYTLGGERKLGDGRVAVDAAVTQQDGEVCTWTFVMRTCDIGLRYKGMWQTHRLLRDDSDWHGRC